MKNENIILKEQIVVGTKTFYLELKVAENKKNYLVFTQESTTNKELQKVKMILFEEELLMVSIAMMKILIAFKSKKNPTNLIKMVKEDYPTAYYFWTSKAGDLLKNLFTKEQDSSEIAEYIGKEESLLNERMKKMDVSIDEIHRLANDD